MPLSEHEQRQLEQIEQALYREDPKFGRLVRSSDPRVHYKRKLVQALIGVLVGAGALAAGVVTHRLYLDAAGAAVMLLSLVWALVSWRRHAARVRPARAKVSQPRAAVGPATVRVPAGLAGPADGAHGRAVAPPAGGRPPDVASARPATPNLTRKDPPPELSSLDVRSVHRRETRAARRSGIRAAPSAAAVITEAGKILARQRLLRRTDAAMPRRAVARSRFRLADPDGRAA